MSTTPRTPPLSRRRKPPRGTGWLPPRPDLRDYTASHPEVAPMLARLGAGQTDAEPSAVDLREWCSPVEDQGNLGACTAHAAMAVVEYFERRASGRHLDGSRLFVYKVTRGLMQEEGDSGAWIRTTMGALRLFGAPPERYWPYTDESPAFDEDPPPFVFGLADDFRAVRYFCHDPMGAARSPEEVLRSVRSLLATGVPAMFGFYGFPSFDASPEPGAIPYPCPDESAEWGHAVAAVGYDDDRVVRNPSCGGETTGALLIRNSWGEAWGDGGYGWLPYRYLLDGLAEDFWSLLSMDWVDTGEFHS